MCGIWCELLPAVDKEAQYQHAHYPPGNGIKRRGPHSFGEIMLQAGAFPGTSACLMMASQLTITTRCILFFFLLFFCHGDATVRCYSPPLHGLRSAAHSGQRGLPSASC